MNTTSTRPIPRAIRRRLALLATTLMTALAMLLGPMAAQSQAAATLPAVPLSRCYPYNTSAKALIQVDPPYMASYPSTVPVYVGADNQAVRYQPLLQKYNGSSWVTVLNGPVYTGLANQWYPTTWYGAAGGTTQWQITRATGAQYYRVVATLTWIADPTHQGYTMSGVVEQKQYASAATGWQPVSYCTY